jgi:hypothetical protein
LKKSNSIECTYYYNYTVYNGFQSEQKNCSDYFFICCPHPAYFNPCCLKKTTTKSRKTTTRTQYDIFTPWNIILTSTKSSTARTQYGYSPPWNGISPIEEYQSIPPYEQKKESTNSTQLYLVGILVPLGLPIVALIVIMIIFLRSKFCNIGLIFF